MYLEDEYPQCHQTIYLFKLFTVGIIFSQGKIHFFERVIGGGGGGGEERKILINDGTDISELIFLEMIENFHFY